jgi:hypothetical protein
VPWRLAFFWVPQAVLDRNARMAGLAIEAARRGRQSPFL